MIPWISKLVTKFVVWDLDGTLYQNEKLGNDIKSYFFKELAKTIPSLTTKKFDELTNTYGSWSAVVSHYTKRNEFDILDDFDKKVVRSDYLSRDPKIIDMIENQLSSYHHLILTNSAIKETLKCLQKIGFNSKTFERIYTRDTMKLMKPDPNIYSLILSDTHTPRFRHLFIGDSIKHDIIPAKSQGFQTLPIWDIEQFI